MKDQYRTVTKPSTNKFRKAFFILLIGGLVSIVLIVIVVHLMIRSLSLNPKEQVQAEVLKKTDKVLFHPGTQPGTQTIEYTAFGGRRITLVFDPRTSYIAVQTKVDPVKDITGICSPPGSNESDIITMFLKNEAIRLISSPEPIMLPWGYSLKNLNGYGDNKTEDHILYTTCLKTGIYRGLVFAKGRMEDKSILID